ncbi:hypothetical protein J8F10_11655 [Gemmata sp. G18]|uniref:Uncharacterized protein n=1 Tax=Gemmata palustris TaxID=2822762 RepID=A0ABS5BRQ6_9BACT|nr:hypothetical protein [Gemmata palustris]
MFVRHPAAPVRTSASKVSRNHRNSEIAVISLVVSPARTGAAWLRSPATTR